MCQEVVELISGYLEETLLPETQERVREHLAHCDNCDTYIEQVRQTIALLRQLSNDPMPLTTINELRDVFQSWKRSQGNS